MINKPTLTSIKRLRRALSGFYVANRIGKIATVIGIEPVVWAIGLVFLAIHNPYVQSEFSICPLKNLGFHYCPGCGLGRSISFFLHGNLMESFRTHILGIPATILLFLRIVTLPLKSIARNKTMSLINNQRSTYGEHPAVNADA